MDPKNVNHQNKKKMSLFDKIKNMISDDHDFDAGFDIEDAELMHTPPLGGFKFEEDMSEDELQSQTDVNKNNKRDSIMNSRKRMSGN